MLCFGSRCGTWPLFTLTASQHVLNVHSLCGVIPANMRAVKPAPSQASACRCLQPKALMHALANMQGGAQGARTGSQHGSHMQALVRSQARNIRSVNLPMSGISLQPLAAPGAGACPQTSACSWSPGEYRAHLQQADQLVMRQQVEDDDAARRVVGLVAPLRRRKALERRLRSPPPRPPPKQPPQQAWSPWVPARTCVLRVRQQRPACSTNWLLVHNSMRIPVAAACLAIQCLRMRPSYWHQKHQQMPL